jgi:hypothetical protein
MIDARLAVAIKNNNESLAQELRKKEKKGANPDCNDGELLFKAVEKSDIEKIKILIGIGADLNIENVHNIFRIVLAARLYQCEPYLEKSRLIGIKYHRDNKISKNECALQQKQLKKQYEDYYFPILKLQITKMLLDAGATLLNINTFDNPIFDSIEIGIDNFKITLFFIIYCKNKINWIETLKDTPRDLFRILKIWVEIAEVIKKKKENAKYIENNDISILEKLDKNDFLKILSKDAKKHHKLVENNESTYNCEVIRRFGDYHQHSIGYGYFLNEENSIDENLSVLIEPEEIENKLGGFWIEEKDIIYIFFGEIFKLAFEVIKIDKHEKEKPYIARYFLIKRNDLNLIYDKETDSFKPFKLPEN